MSHGNKSFKSTPHVQQLINAVKTLFCLKRNVYFITANTTDVEFFNLIGHKLFYFL